MKKILSVAKMASTVYETETCLACTDLSFACSDSEVLHNNRQEEDKKFNKEDYIT